MKQLLQEVRTGEAELGTSPNLRTSTGTLVTATRRSLISAGIERMMVDFGKPAWLIKARHRPVKVGEVLDKPRTDGVLATMMPRRPNSSSPCPRVSATWGACSKSAAGWRGPPLRPARGEGQGIAGRRTRPQGVFDDRERRRHLP
jgi:hypothetical protein